MVQKRSDNLLDDGSAAQQGCNVCSNLLRQMEQLLDMLVDVQRESLSDWLTVAEVASELKISKSIVYRLIRNGELEAVNIVDNTEKISQKGHYRIEKSCLKKFLESKRVKFLLGKSRRSSSARKLPKVKDYLGI